LSLLTLSSLYVDFPTDDDLVRAVNGVDLSITEAEVVGLIGESGCGKSVPGLSHYPGKRGTGDGYEQQGL